jgi:hypothetical protein
VRLVLERPPRPLSAPPVWYAKGRTGSASLDREAAIQLPVSFVSAVGQEDWGQELGAAGKPILVSFHRNGMGPGQVLMTLLGTP